MKKTESEITLAIMGDVMLGRLVNEVLTEIKDPEYIWGNTLPILRQADLRLINLECTISDFGQPWIKTPKVFHFRASPTLAIPALKAAKIDFCSLANNHCLDFREQGLLETIKNLDSANIKHAGAGRNLPQAKEPAALKFHFNNIYYYSGGGERSPQGKRETALLPLTIISVTDNEPSWEATAERPGVYYLPPDPTDPRFAILTSQIQKLKQAGNFVIVSAHLGPNMLETPLPRYQILAQALLNTGVDLYWGHSAHLFQGIAVYQNIYQNQVILYDTGDFIDDYAVDESLRNDWSFIFLLTLIPRNLAKPQLVILKIELVPVQISNCQVNLASSPDSQKIISKMVRLSSAFGTQLIQEGPKLSLNFNS